MADVVVISKPAPEEPSGLLVREQSGPVLAADARQPAGQRAVDRA